MNNMHDIMNSDGTMVRYEILDRDSVRVFLVGSDRRPKVFSRDQARKHYSSMLHLGYYALPQMDDSPDWVYDRELGTTRPVWS